jgi:hypothetical protein
MPFVARLPTNKARKTGDNLKPAMFFALTHRNPSGYRLLSPDIPKCAENFGEFTRRPPRNSQTLNFEG